MNHVDNKPMNETRSLLRIFLDLFVGVLGSLVLGNIGLILFAKLDPQHMWVSYFKSFWILVLAGLAMILYTRKRPWISIGVVAAMVLMAL